ncbi:MAG: ArsR family transcriptional regulator [Candidatus Bathyarchaeia archaeon]
MDWNKYGYIFSSDYRKKVVYALLAGPKTPKQISLEAKLYLSHVSKTLNELQENEIAVCLTPGLKRGRMYQLTKEGEEIANYLKEKK